MPTMRGRLRRTQAAMPRPEAQIGDGHPVSLALQGCADIFEPERFDPEKGAQSEAVIAGMGTEQQDVHGFIPGSLGNTISSSP